MKQRSAIALLLAMVLIVTSIAGCTSSKPAGPEQGKAGPKFPERPISVIVQFAAGGATDRTVRVLAAEVEKNLGVPINVTNMPGATGAVATMNVLQAPKDGYTWLGASDNIRTYAVMDLCTSTWKDWDNLVGAIGFNIIAVPVDSKYKTIVNGHLRFPTFGHENSSASDQTSLVGGTRSRLLMR